MTTPIAEHPGFAHIDRLLAGGAPSPQATDLLISIGVMDPPQAARNLQSLALHPAFPREDPGFLAQLLAALGETFEPERALSNFERILETRENPDALLKSLRRSADRRSILLTLAGGSQFLSDTILRHPPFLDWLLRPSTLAKRPGRSEMGAELWRWVRRALREGDDPAAALRRYRQREYLRIGLCDLLRRARMRETTRALSDLADACLEVSVRLARAELEARYGRPRRRDAGGRRRPCGFAIIALGKLGGRELNFSSDIDLLFVYASDEGETTGVAPPFGGRRGGRISNHDFHARLARRVISLMAENTEDGHVFRVDTRLRPEGGQGALVYSLRSCEIYYESWGETWERQALIKARPAAGDPALGEAFLEMIRPFIYRRTLDLSALDEIGRIKDRINSRLGAGASGQNVKLGEGGIREIEFIVQAHQLIYGGKEPLLRTPNTLEALSVIEALGLLPIGDCEHLADAYVFLRDVEHRVQVTHGLQTHDLPATPRGLTVLARKMGFRPEGGRGEAEVFGAALNHHQERVSRVFQNLFRSREAPAGPAAGSAEGPARPLAAETLEDSLSPADLAPYNFRDPGAASAQLRLLRNGAPFEHVSARAKRMFDALLPRLLYLTLELPDPGRAVANLHRFVERAGGREAVFSLMAENERIFEILLRLFSASDYLSEILLAQPGLLDGLLQPEALTASKPPEVLGAELDAIAARAGGAEKAFPRLCEAKQAEELSIGMRSLLGEADILDTLADLTRLAEAVVRAGLAIAGGEVRALHGTPVEEETGREAAFAVIGMGKLGSGDMNFGSDLDLVFVYSAGGRTRGGRRAVPNHDHFLKLATTLRDGLASPAAGGRAYAIDLRLRPEGQQGALAAPLAVYEAYFRGRAETWERQALTRARPVAGDPALGRAFMERVEAFVYERPVPEDLAAQVDHMRGRLERELAREAEGRIDIKLGQGGITDIEFIVQYLLIVHGRENPGLRRPGTYGAIGALSEAGLLGPGETGPLREAYRFLRLVENRLRIAHAQPLHTFPRTPEGMEMLARRLGYVDDEEGSARAKLLADYERQTRLVRGIYRRVIGGEAAGAGRS